jgi:hypothetical protein
VSRCHAADFRSVKRLSAQHANQYARSGIIRIAQVIAAVDGIDPYVVSVKSRDRRGLNESKRVTAILKARVGPCISGLSIRNACSHPKLERKRSSGKCPWPREPSRNPGSGCQRRVCSAVRFGALFRCCRTALWLLADCASCLDPCALAGDPSGNQTRAGIITVFIDNLSEKNTVPLLPDPRAQSPNAPASH